MKKIIKCLPLLVLPLLLASCEAFDFGKVGGDDNTPADTDGNDDGTTPSGESTVYPETLEISGNNTVTVGLKTSLTATYTPSNVTYKTITWSSSDSSVAKVNSSGRVSGVSGGNVTITASMKAANGTITATKDMTVEWGATTSISLNSTSKNLGYGATFTLTATVNDYSDPNITWSTSNASVASLDKTSTTSGQSVTVTAGSVTDTATITATAADGTHKATCTINVSDDPLDAYTLLFYVCGANLESGVGYDGYGIDNPLGCATSDINEILNTAGQPDDVNIVLECGGAKKWKNSTIDAHINKLSRWHVSNNTLVHDEDVNKASMGLSSTLQSFIEYGINNYPAQKYGLFMWNHGGALSGVCFDENYSDDSITNAELYTAVRNARTNCGLTEKLEFIAYDACLMAVQDVAEYNSLNFNYMISSQETEWDGGYDYDAWLPTLYSNPSGVSTQTLLEKIGDTFMDYFSYQDDQTQSVYDLSKMADYMDSFETLANSLRSIVNSQEKWETFIEYIHSCLGYGGDDYSDEGLGTLYSYDVYDAKQALEQIKSHYSSVASQAQDAIDKLEAVVTWHRNGTKAVVKDSCGMSLFCSIDEYLFSYSFDKSSAKSSYLSQTHFSNWGNFIYTYDTYWVGLGY